MRCCLYSNQKSYNTIVKRSLHCTKLEMVQISSHKNPYIHILLADAKFSIQYSKTCFKKPLKKKTKIGFHDRLLLNAGQKCCRVLQGVHSVKILAFIKLPFFIKIFVMSMFEWPFYTGFTVLNMGLDARKPVFGVFKQQRRRPDGASAQSDQCLCYSCIGKYHILTCYERNFFFLASLCS